MGTFRHTADNIIEIDGEEFELDLFLEVEPEYTLPEECVSRYYDGEQHILRTNSTQFAGGLPWIDGERYITRVPDLYLLIEIAEQDEQYVQLLKKDKPEEPKRIDRYPHTDTLIVAMWEHFVEGRPAEKTINIVQEQRLNVKEQFPK